MHFSLSHKIQRYRGLLKEVSNWPSYLLFKARPSHHPAFTFKLRSTNRISVSKPMLPPFKEIFFDQVYLQGFPKKLLQNEALTVIDIGANVGFFSFFMQFRYPGAQIYAFEPMPFNFNVLQKYVKESRFKTLFPVNKAVAGTTGKLLLHYAGDHAYTTMASTFKNQRKVHSLDVEAVSLEQIFSDYGLQTVDLLKMDCEGSEYDILYKTPVALFQKINALCIETHNGLQANENTASLAAFLQAQGYCQQASQKKRTGYIWAWRNSL